MEVERVDGRRVSTELRLQLAAAQVPQLYTRTSAGFWLWAYYNCDTSTIRLRFEHESTTTRYEMRTIRVRFERDTTCYEELCAFEQ